MPSPLLVRDNHPSGSVLATRSEIRFGPLPPNTRTPATRTLTNVTALAIGATQGVWTAATPMVADDGAEFTFGTQLVRSRGNNPITPILTIAAAAAAAATTLSITSPVTYNLIAGTRIVVGGNNVTLQSSVTLGTTAVTVNCDPIPAAITANTAITGNPVDFYAPLTAAIAVTTASNPFIYTLGLLGIQSISQPNKTNLISIRSMQSGLGNEQRAVMIDFTLQISGWIHQRDRAMAELIEPAQLGGFELYCEYYSPRGVVKRGTVYIGDNGSTEKTDDVVKYDLTVGFQGIPAQAAFSI